MSNTLEYKIREINKCLKKDFLCLPPYQCINGILVNELYNDVKNNIPIVNKITQMVKLPWQRAYQMEYRFLKANIFTPFLQVIEYATYDVYNRNAICAYLSLLPLVEALFRKWGMEAPDLTIEKMSKIIDKNLEYFNSLIKNKCFPKDRRFIPKSYLEYLKFILQEVFYISFKKYETNNFLEVFNRNLSLHKLEGLTNNKEISNNVTRILLLVDVVAELYLMQNPQEYWYTILEIEYQKDLDFQIRFELYKKILFSNLYLTDINYIRDILLNSTDGNRKRDLLEKLKLQKI